MMNDGNAVRRHHRVEFQHIHTEIESFLEGGKGVFRDETAGAAMALNFDGRGQTGKSGAQSGCKGEGPGKAVTH